ncbi:MAG: 3-hydroxyacyl-ACP dehydratase [Flavobacteriales bacterium]|nr:3-hydroxyacyl-ACP dehydratase [Flavobacteriales bacterium]
MLFKGFYNNAETISSDHNKLIVRIKLNKDHDIYNGHFPNNPITPGVISIQIIKEILEEHLGYELFLREIINIKYISPINPIINNFLLFEIFLQKENKFIIVKNNIMLDNDKIAVKFKGKFLKKS